MGSLSDIIRKLEECRQKRAAWKYVEEHLFEFAGDDAITPTQAIKADGCVGSVVSREVVQELIRGIREEKIIPLEEEIAELENIKVAETKNAERKAPSEKQQPGKKDAKGVRLVPPAPKVGGGGRNPAS